MNYPFRYFNSSLEVIRLAVVMVIRYPLSLRQVRRRLEIEDICGCTVLLYKLPGERRLTDLAGADHGADRAVAQ